MILNLLDIEPAMGVLNGLGMEVDDCAFPLVKEIVKTADPMVAFKVLRAVFESLEKIIALLYLDGA
jgi:hypothetical protein